ncbi:MAG: SLC13 family permease [Candidatus Krumholzibacteriota bacterium]|nr:SLC13 family permease [Candidatus Krumholzibacteriota bacterium]
MTTDIALILAVLGVTIVLFVSERLRVDVIALLIMVSLAWLRLLEPLEAFSGLASNAVISVIAVMILGHGVDRSGVMKRIIRPILRAAGTHERQLTALVSAVAGLLSAFMQNIGAAALFLPAMMRISKRTGMPVSRLLMPLGFAAILGGTCSMVGSGPLIILNDLLRQRGVRPFGIFDVTPIGLSLLAAGIAYFAVVGYRLLPAGTTANGTDGGQRRLVQTWNLPTTLHQCRIPAESPLVGRTRDEASLWSRYGLNLLALAQEGDVMFAPWRHTRFAAGQELVLLGEAKDVGRFVADNRLEEAEESGVIEDLRSEGSAGFAEAVIPMGSPVAGKSLREVALRNTFGVEPIMLLTGRRGIRDDFSDEILEPGATVIVHGLWGNVLKLEDDRSFVLATSVGGSADGRPRPSVALACFLGAILLAFSGVQLSLALLTGALAMILLGVVPIDGAYRAVDWRTVFLLAGLIPLGTAMDRTGAAALIAERMMSVLSGSHPLLVMAAISALATLFSLFLSNVAATVLLVPLVMILGAKTGIEPRALAILVAVSSANSFVLPTHQVNALLMSPGGYHNRDYLRAGGIMTVVFIIVATGVTYALFA